MSKFILLYNYNKYYNRIIKKLNSYADYKALITPLGSTPAQYKGFEFESVNFNWEDGVFAKHVINIPRNSNTFYNYHEPDYLVLERSYKDGDTPVTELSRWFVLETTKIRGNQLEVSLRRDLLSDFYNEVLTAPVFIEKGNPGSGDPAIFNRESMTYNQIKQKEYKLNFDKRSGRGYGWIVGYIAKKDSNDDIGPCVGTAKPPQSIIAYNDLPQKIKDLITAGEGYLVYNDQYVMNFQAKITDDLGVKSQKCYLIYHREGTAGGVFRHYPTSYVEGVTDLGYPSATVSGTIRSGSYNNDFTDYAAEKFLIAKDELSFQNKLNTWFNSLPDNDVIFNDTMLENYKNIVYSRNNKIYILRFNPISGDPNVTQEYTLAQVKSQANDLCSFYKSFVENYLFPASWISENTQADNSKATVSFGKTKYHYSVYAEEVGYNAITTTISKHRNANLDAPYDLFCIPMDRVNVKKSGQIELTCIGNIALAISQAISITGSSLIYDIQILPYCPFEEVIDSSGDIDITGFTENYDYDYILSTLDNSKLGIIIYPKTCRGTFDMSIPSGSEVYQDCLAELNDPIEQKIKSETKVCRFVSPNFASTFDINVQKNAGITELNVDYFYKPYSPYIHVAPYFNYMYGFDFNDPKGLICSGEFSIATAQSQWETYQIQNKNFENIFNRQIQNLDVNNSIAYDQMRITGKIGVATAGLTGIAGGAIAGGTAGGPIGAAVGAVAGGIGSAIASGVGAKYDLEYLKKSQTEARSFAQDMYAYSLGNIQALPYSLTRVSTFTENNKVFPFIEFYDCTDEEKEALRNKIKYNGMTVMRIGRIIDFIGSNHKYVQGQLIRLEGVNEDSHVIAEIANEIKEGAYYYGSDSIES